MQHGGTVVFRPWAHDSPAGRMPRPCSAQNGQLVAASGAVGTRDEELLNRTAGPALASLERSPGNGTVIRITDAEMMQYLAGGAQGQGTAVTIAEAIQPPVGHPGLMTTLPASVRSNVFRHGAGRCT